MPSQKISLPPNFIIGAISFILFLLGVVIKGNGYAAGTLIVLTAILLHAIHWTCGIKKPVFQWYLNSRSKALVDPGFARSSHCRHDLLPDEA